MEDLPEYADLLGRGGETIAMAAAKYLYSMANFGEPWTTEVRDACLVLEKLDFSKEHQETDIREIITLSSVTIPLHMNIRDSSNSESSTLERPTAIGTGITDNHGELGLGLHVPAAMIAQSGIFGLCSWQRLQLGCGL